MTAPQLATPGSDSVRAQIAEVATTELRLVLMTRVAEEFGGRIADVLVPLVDRLRDDAKAEALEQAAKKIRSLADGPVPAINDAFDAVVILRARAAVYRTNPSSEETHRGE